MIRNAGHGNFSREEILRAWQDLMQWVEQDEKPEGDDLLGDLAQAGIKFTNPIRDGDPLG